MWQDAHIESRGLKQTVEIPHYGEESLFKAPWRFSGFASRITRCGPTTGEHNARVFGDLLGLSAGEIADLSQRGIIA